MLGFVEGDLDDMAAYPRLTDGEPLVGHGVPDGLQVHKCIREMYLMTFRPDGTADQRKAIKTGIMEQPPQLIKLCTYSAHGWCQRLKKTPKPAISVSMA